MTRTRRAVHNCKSHRLWIPESREEQASWQQIIQAHDHHADRAKLRNDCEAAGSAEDSAATCREHLEQCVAA